MRRGFLSQQRQSHAPAPAPAPAPIDGKCLVCAAARTASDRNADARVFGAPACAACVARWGDDVALRTPGECLRLLKLGRLAPHMEAYATTCPAFPALGDSDLAAALANLRANRAMGKKRAGAAPAAAGRPTSRLLDDATLLRMLRGPDYDVRGFEAPRTARALRAWVERSPEGFGLYGAYAFLEALLQNPGERRVVDAWACEKTLAVRRALRGRGARFVDAASLLALSLASRGAAYLFLPAAALWRTVAVAACPALDDGRDRRALEWRAALHFQRLRARRGAATAAPRVPATATCVPRLMVEAREMLGSPPPGLYASPADEKDVTKWICTICGPAGSAYDGGMFRLSADFPPDYPLNPPRVAFLTALFHPNVDARSGRVCVDLLEPDHWTPAASIRVLLLSLQSLLCDPTALDAASPANVEAARLMATDRAAFDARSRADADASLDFYRNGEGPPQPHPPPPEPEDALGDDLDAEDERRLASLSVSGAATAPGDLFDDEPPRKRDRMV